MNTKFLTTLFLTLFCCLTAFGQQEERIIRFHADMVIDTTGMIAVTEHIRVYAAGKEIKHGIVRKLPRTRWGKSAHYVEYENLSVSSNKAKKYHTEREDKYLAVYIGDADVLLDPGVCDYTIKYEINDIVSFYDEYDKLNLWDVTDWVGFVVEQASATITLPPGAAVKDFKATCTGGCSSEVGENTVTFTANRPLNSREEDSMIVSVAFTRDVIRRPPSSGGGSGFGFILLIFSFFLFIAGVAFWAGRNQQKKYKSLLQVCTGQVEGVVSDHDVVTETHRVRDENDEWTEETHTTIYPIFSYRVGDEPYQYRSEANAKKFQKGKKVTVYYNPLYPKQCYVEGDHAEKATVIGLYVLGAIFLAVALGFLIKWGLA